MRSNFAEVTWTASLRTDPRYWMIPWLLTAIIGCWSVTAAGAEVTLQWDRSDTALGYRLHYGTQSAVYDNTVDVGGDNQFTVAELEEGRLYYFAVTAYNDTAESDFSEEVVFDAHVNQPPVADAGPDKTVVAATAVTLDGSNSADPDDGIARLAWEQVEGPAVSLANPQDEVLCFTAPQVGSGEALLIFQLTVQDYGALYATDTCRVTVTAPSTGSGPAPEEQSEASADKVIIVQAVYSSRRDRLMVTATSNADARGIVLTAWADMGGTEVLLGDLRYSSRRHSYSGNFRNIDATPDRIIVTSSAGGMSTSPCAAR